VLAELRLEVDDVMRDADGGGDPARVGVVARIVRGAQDVSREAELRAIADAIPYRPGVREAVALARSIRLTIWLRMCS